MAKRPAERDYLKLKPGQSAATLGRSAAELDPELQDYYVDPDRYVKRALDFNDPAVFFVGPKGAGKSAILQMVKLHRAIDTDRVIVITPDDLAFSALANITATTPIMSEATKNQWLFKALWDYILALEVLRREHKDRSSFASALRKIVRIFFGNQHEAEVDRLLEISLGDDGQQVSLSSRILQLVKEVEISAESHVAGKVTGKAKLDEPKATPGGQLWLLNLIHSVAKKIADHLSAPYHILIDDLDLHWQDTPVQNAFIAALFQSLRNFCKPPHLKSVVAIRDQIFRRLPLTDRDKYHDWVCHVEWEEPNLQLMIEKRAVSKLDIRSKDVWGGLFPAHALTKILRHSYGRPREAIRIVSLSIAEGQKKRHTQVTEEDLDLAIRKFSDARIAEIAQEFNHLYTGLDPVIRRFAGWPKEFPLDKLKELAGELWLSIQIGEDISQEYLWAGGFEEDPKGLAKILLECGILLFKSNRTAEPAKYDLENRQEITNDTWLAIHPVYWPALKL